MSVNLCAQEGEEPRDVVLHFDVRFLRDNIISLSRKNGIWIGSGNYDTNYNMFVPGTKFRIVFEVKDTDVITIYCQGKFHSNFLPKIPLSMARYIVAWADIERITHCFFHKHGKGLVGEELHDDAASYVQQSPRATIANVIRRDMKLNGYRVPKEMMPGHVQQQSSDEGAEEVPKMRTLPKKYFQNLMCQATDRPKLGSPSNEPAMYRRMAKPQYFPSRKTREASDSDGSNSESDSEELASKNMESSTMESDVVLPDVKKRGRRSKFGSLAQVVNFMAKTKRGS